MIETVLTAAAHPAGALVVNVTVVAPETAGVKVDVREFTFEKVPLGALQVELVALPPIVPARVTVPPKQTTCGVPALAVGAGFTVTVAVTAQPLLFV